MTGISTRRAIPDHMTRSASCKPLGVDCILGPYSGPDTIMLSRYHNVVLSFAMILSFHMYLFDKPALSIFLL